MDRAYYVYIIASKRNGTLYLGVTNDLIRRIYEHRNQLIEGFSSKHEVEMLVWYECHGSIESAIIREKRIKDWKREWKLNLIEKTNPDWKDLYDEIVL